MGKENRKIYINISNSQHHCIFEYWPRTDYGHTPVNLGDPPGLQKSITLGEREGIKSTPINCFLYCIV